MKRFFRFAIPLLAVGILAALPALVARAQDAPATKPAKVGSVIVKVLDADGKVVSGATVRITVPRNRGGGGGGGGARPAPVGQGTTDDKGMVTIKDIPVGEYSASAMVQDKGRGRTAVTIVEDKPAEVTINLAAPNN